MKSLAIIGTGIAGLGAAHFLHHRYDLTLFEQNDYAGGHTNTITVDEAGRAVSWSGSGGWSATARQPGVRLQAMQESPLCARASVRRRRWTR